MLKSIVYLANQEVRPDYAFITNILGQWQAAPTQQYITAINYIYDYI